VTETLIFDVNERCWILAALDPHLSASSVDAGVRLGDGSESMIQSAMLGIITDSLLRLSARWRRGGAF
jgi:hypothetical protein